MNLQEISRKYFSGLEAGGGKLLYQQLYDCLESMVEDLPHKSEFPPERELAAALQVNRNTLRRAIGKLVESGVLVRSNKGTFVHKKEKSAPEFHPFLYSDFPPVGTVKPALKLMLYENMPEQVQFWNEAAAEFRKRTGTAVKIDWLDVKCRTNCDYRDVVESLKPDLFQLRGLSAAIPPEIAELMQSPPPELEQLFSGPDYLNSYFRQVPLSDSRVIPLYFTPFVEIINLELLKKYGIEPEGFSAGYSLEKFLDRCVAGLPQDIYISGHSGTLCTAGKYPETITRESARRNISSAMRMIEKLKPRGASALMMPLDSPFHWYAPELNAAFTAGQLLHMGGRSLFMAHWSAGWPFEVQFALPGNNTSSCAMDVAMAFVWHKDSTRQDETAEFIRFLLSGEMQCKLARETGVMPFHRDAVGVFAEKFSMDPGITAEQLQGHREASHSHLVNFWGAWSRQPYFERILNQGAGADEMIELALNDFWKHHQQIGE
jgi:ABC-type glycerol-3-phosphate transport system substrate-binding protein